MNVLIQFPTTSTAYAALAEVRRLSSDLAWDLRVHESGRAALLMVPTDRWLRDEALRDVAALYGGSFLRRTDRLEPQPRG